MNNIYQHYRPEEQVFIDKVFEWIEYVNHVYVPYLTHFLTPREVMIVEQLTANNEEIKISIFGGYAEAERCRILLYPIYYELQENEFNLSILDIKYPTKFSELSHGKILGTILSTGITRDRIGDIITDGNKWQIILDKNISLYIKTNVTKIANVGIQLNEILLDEIIKSNETWEEVHVIASSLRLDTVLGKVYNFSRQRSKTYISSGNVKVNFTQVERPDIEIGEKDIISLRKFGRFWINQIDGITKKDNYRLSIHVLNR